MGNKCVECIFEKDFELNNFSPPCDCCKDNPRFKFIETLTDADYRYISEDKIYRKCIECDNYVNGSCSNIYSYPIMPKDFGCENSRGKIVVENNKKESKIVGFYRRLLGILK